MNRYRLNQILEILLFPVSDSKQGREDPLLACYQAYHEFIEESRRSASSVQERNRKNGKYRRAKKELVSYLAERCHGNVKSKDDIHMICELYYPMGDMEKEMEHLRRLCLSKGCVSRDMENVSSYYIKSLSRISQSLITYRDGSAAIRQWVDKREDGMETDMFGSSSVFNKIEIWNLLCRFTVPDIYIAIAAVDNYLGMEALYEQKANIVLADKLLIKSIRKGIAENHLHFNVGFDYEVVWLSNMDLKFVEEMEPDKWDRDAFARLEMALFRCVAACYMMQADAEQGFDYWLNSNMSEEICAIVKKLYDGVYESCVDNADILAVYQLYGNLKSEDSIRQCDYLLDKVYRRYVEYKTSSEFLLLYQCYKYVKQNETDTFFARVFLQYIRLKNEFFSKVYERHIMQGLKYFQEVYDDAKKTGLNALNKEERMVEIFRAQAKMTSLKKLEIRIAPDVNGMEMDHFHYHKCRRSILSQLYGQIYSVLSAYRRFILENTIGVTAAWEWLRSREKKPDSEELENYVREKIRRSRLPIPTLGIVFHFLKSEHLEDVSGYYCWRNVMEGSGRHSAYRMLRRLHMANIAAALEEIRESIPRLNEYIVGIDAASDENAMEPWMAAPAYKVMRSHVNTKPVMEMSAVRGMFEKIQNIGFTYHVGEDFRHVASGLRHVSEVLEEFGYKAGDRLGHALVLGLDVEQWVRENEVVPIPILEHLENLLWMWGMNTCEGLELPIQLEVLEDTVMNIARKLYEKPESITVKMLYSAYKKKFGICHEEIAEQLLKGTDKEAFRFCCCETNGEECYHGWTADKLLMTHYCPVYEEKYEAIELLPIRKTETEIYRILQNYLISKIEKMGIYIEVNPTSNLTIGDFAHMYQHPVFYLNQRGGEAGHHALVTINSDDPAVFNTNVENELAYIYYAAEAQGYTKSEILEWIDKIRQYGMDASFIQQEKSAEQIWMETGEMLQAIERIVI